MNTIDQMQRILTSNPDVLGLIEYGSCHKREHYTIGDYDVFIILKHRSEAIEGLHFYVEETPVDMNVRTLEQLQNMNPPEGFDRVLLNGRVIYDPTGKVSEAIAHMKKREKSKARSFSLSQNEIAMIRHGHTHVLDKVKGRFETMPLFCEFLLSTNIYWLIQNYFRVRNLPFEGEKRALIYLEEKEGVIYKGIRDFFCAVTLEEKVEISNRLTELILAPIQGPWKQNELLVFGDDDAPNLHVLGEALFKQLFPHQSHN